MPLDIMRDVNIGSGNGLVQWHLIPSSAKDALETC